MNHELPLHLVGRLRRSFAAVAWLRSYTRQTFVADLLAGVTLGAYLLPAAIGDASLAGLPPESGLYACLFGGLAFWLFCSSKQTAISVTSAISLLLGSRLGELANGSPARFASLAAATALLIALIGFVAWLVKAGAIVRFVSEGVMVGFKCGVAMVLASTQLPKLLGFPGAHGNFWENSRHVLRTLGETNAIALCIGGVALTAILLGKARFPHKPIALFVVVAGIAASHLLAFESRGVTLLGKVPQELPTLGLPAVSWDEINQLLPLGLACFLLGAVETAAIGRMFASKHGGRFDANQEFLALSVANLAAGLGRGFPVSGGMSQSLVNEEGGARTPLSNVVAAILILTVILFLADFLERLPQPVIAAIVLAAVTSLFNLHALRHFWREDRREFVVAIAALAAVLGSGLLQGVLIGCIISLLQLVHRASRPHVALLGRIPGTQRFSDCDRHPENQLVPGMLIFRPESALVYFNIDHVREVITSAALADEHKIELVALDLSAVPHIDIQSAHALGEMAHELAAAGIRVQAVEARSSIRDRLRHEAVDGELGRVWRLNSLHDVAQEYQNSRESASPLSSGR